MMGSLILQFLSNEKFYMACPFKNALFVYGKTHYMLYSETRLPAFVYFLLGLRGILGIFKLCNFNCDGMISFNFADFADFADL